MGEYMGQSVNTCISVNTNNFTSVKMPSTPQMRKANEKNAKNVTKRGNVVKSSKTDEKYPVSPELIVSSALKTLRPCVPKYFFIPGPLCLRCHRLCSFPDYPVCVGGIPLEDLHMFLQNDDADVQNQPSIIRCYFLSGIIIFSTLLCVMKTCILS